MKKSFKQKIKQILLEISAYCFAIGILLFLKPINILALEAFNVSFMPPYSISSEEAMIKYNKQSDESLFQIKEVTHLLDEYKKRNGIFPDKVDQLLDKEWSKEILAKKKIMSSKEALEFLKNASYYKGKLFIHLYSFPSFNESDINCLSELSRNPRLLRYSYAYYNLQSKKWDFRYRHLNFVATASSDLRTLLFMNYYLAIIASEESDLTKKNILCDYYGARSRGEFI